jgi:hypothetical protein
MRSTRWLAGCVMAVSALLAAGCGGSGSGSPPSATALAGQMRSAIKGATSVHVTGTVAESGQTIHMDLSLTRSGSMSGTIGIGPAPITILATGGKVYMKMTAAALSTMHLPSSACAMVCNKYLVLPAAQAQGLTGNMGWSQLLNPSTSKYNPGPGTKVTGPVTINGQSAWKVSDNSGTGYVAASGPAYPLRITPPRGQGIGEIDFSQWNSVKIPSPPPASQQVNLSKLGG